jgi:cell division protein FtsL
MITRATLIWAVLAIAAGFGLFQVSYRVASLEDELNRVNRQIVEERERLHALQADWSYLTNPSRLADLARRHLPLQPLAAEQMIRIEDLPLRLAPLMAEGDGFRQAEPTSPPEAAAAMVPPEAAVANATQSAPANEPAPAAITEVPPAAMPAAATTQDMPADQSDDPIGDLLQKVNAEQ